MIHEIWVELLIGLGIPGVGAVVFAVRAYMAKNKCFILMKQKLDYLETEIKRAKERDVDIFNRLNIVDKSIANISGKMDILISQIKP